MKSWDFLKMAYRLVKRSQIPINEDQWEKSVFAQEKEAVNILCQNGVDAYMEFLNTFDVIDFLNEEEKQYILGLNLEKIVYSHSEYEKQQLKLDKISGTFSINPVHPEDIDYKDESRIVKQCVFSVRTYPEIVFSQGILMKINELIWKASSSIKIAIFMFTYDSIFRRICKKKLRHPNVHVHILVDDKQFEDFMIMAKKVIKKDFGNQQIGINVKSINKPSRKNPGRAHEKFMIIDDSIVSNGSFNFTWTSEFINHENVIISNEVSIVRPFLQHYEELSQKGEYEIL